MRAAVLLAAFASLFLCVLGQSGNCPSAVTPTYIYYGWLGGNGYWEDSSKWNTTGYPRSGTHIAVFNVGGNYTVRHRNFLLAGGLIVTAPNVTIVLDDTIGWLIDPNTIPLPLITIVGQFVDGTVNVTLTDFISTPVTSGKQIVLTNMNTGLSYTGNLTSLTEPGTYNGTFTLKCDNNATGVVNAQAFDTIVASDVIGNTSFSESTMLLYTDNYQVRWGWATISQILFTRAVQKNLAGLLKLRDKLNWIETYLPPYEDNHCCSDESYIYPIPLENIAVQSYYFLTGTPSQEYKECYITLPQFCDRVNTQYGSEIGPVPIQWTGLGASLSWSDPNNWTPARVPNFINAQVSILPATLTYIYLEEDIQIGSLTTNPNVFLNQEFFNFTVGLPTAQIMRKIWFGENGEWQNPARWTPEGVPAANQTVVLAGFGTINLIANVTVADIIDVGAALEAEQMAFANITTNTLTVLMA